MKRFLLVCTLAFACMPALWQAYAQNTVNDVAITVTLATDGSAQIREVWDMTLSRGTEVYLGRENLGDIKIKDLTVSDETGETYITDRSWDTDRSFEKKKGHCGLNSISGGYEICWGIGEYGHRTWTVDYTLTNLVKSLDDYDMIHYQFYTPNDFRAEHVKITLTKPDYQVDTLTRLWAFGYDGYVWREDGSVIAETENPMEPNYSIILLVRFDKGVFEPTSVQERPFQVVLDRALDGADEPDVPLTKFEETLYTILGAIFSFGMVMLPFLPFIIRRVQKRKAKKDAFGTLHLSEISWSRELPYNGEILPCYYVISNSSELKTNKNSVASAMILHMLQSNCLQASKDAEGKILITFNPNGNFKELHHTEEKLWSMMYEASGSNKILEEKEFSTWASSHNSKLANWTSSVKSSGLDKLRTGKYYVGAHYTETGQAENRKLIGFKKFLEDTTLIKERATVEVALWRDYLIFASLIGIADKVAKELKDINPVVFEQVCSMSYSDMRSVLSLTNSYANVVTRYAYHPSYSSSSGSYSGGFSRSGGGGHSSFGGGGGFSGGGHSGVR